MKKGLKGFGFLVAGLVLGIIGTITSIIAVSLSGVGIAKVRRDTKE